MMLISSHYQLQNNSAYAAYTTPRSWSLEMPVPSGSKQSYKGFSVSSPSETTEQLAVENTIKHSKAASSTTPPPPPTTRPTTTAATEQHSLVAALPQTVAHLNSICLSANGAIIERILSFVRSRNLRIIEHQ